MTLVPSSHSKFILLGAILANVFSYGYCLSGRLAGVQSNICTGSNSCCQTQRSSGNSLHLGWSLHVNEDSLSQLIFVIHNELRYSVSLMYVLSIFQILILSVCLLFSEGHLVYLFISFMPVAHHLFIHFADKPLVKMNLPKSHEMGLNNICCTWGVWHLHLFSMSETAIRSA